MRLRRLGRTELQVSELSLGTVELGMDYGIAVPGAAGRPDECRAAAILHAALDQGINLIDTARVYGEAEAIIGRHLKSRRDEFVLVSKVQAKPPDHGHVRRSVEESLRALETECIDVMLIHSAHNATPDAAAAETLERCREAGMVRFLGASVYGEAAAREALDSPWCDCIEVAYSPLDRRPEAAIFPQARTRDVGVLARSVLLKGALTTRIGHLGPHFEPLRRAVEALAESTQVAIEDLPELAYRYALSSNPPHSALVGTADEAELRKCILYAERGALPESMRAEIRCLQSLSSTWLNPGEWPPL